MSYTLHLGDVADAYANWPSPDCIIVDGPYGVGGFFGDPRTPESLDRWYSSHIKEWTKKAKLSTTLWFWGTEIGWATVHPELAKNGWDYVQMIHWDKGIGHVAGNVNGKTIRQYPIVNEICVFYSKKMEFRSREGLLMPAKEWLLHEWMRTGLPKKKANDACGVKEAASRKYLDQGWLWYPPPSEMMEKMAVYANEFGDPAGRPYFSIDGRTPVTAEQWKTVRYAWNHEHGVTNVWQHPQLRNEERIKGIVRRHAPRIHKPKKGVTAQLNQKPLEFMSRILNSVTKPGHIVWEPFGGLCSASVAAIEMDRVPFAAEIDHYFHSLAKSRLEEHLHKIRLGSDGLHD